MKSSISQSAAWLFTTRKRTPTRSSPHSTTDRGCDPRARSPAQGGRAVRCAVDGIVPEGHLRSPEKTYQDLMSWLERLSTGQVASVPAARGNLARDRQNEADVIYGRYGRQRGEGGSPEVVPVAGDYGRARASTVVRHGGGREHSPSERAFLVLRGW